MSSVDIEFSFRKSLFRSKRVKRKIISVPVIAPIKKKKILSLAVQRKASGNDAKIPSL